MILGRRGSRPGFSMTTAHFQAAYPFLAQGGLQAPGVYIGRDATGGAFAFDPWELYARRIIRSPNMLVLGGIGYAKSALLKTYVFRQHVFGRQAWVIDVKGEYGPLAAALGVAPIRLAPGGEVRLNPIERRGGRESQLSLLRSVAVAALRRELAPEEDAGLRVALDLVNEEAGAREPTLPMVVDALLHPRTSMVEGVSAPSAEDFAEANRNSALALQRLCEGDLRGMFDGPTTDGIDFEAPLVVLDLSAMENSSALGILMTCAGAWQQAILLERKRRAQQEDIVVPKVLSIVEEVWRVANQIGVAEWLQSNFKLCRAVGIMKHPLRPPSDRLRRERLGRLARGADHRRSDRRRGGQSHLSAAARSARAAAQPTRPQRAADRADDGTRSWRSALGAAAGRLAGLPAALGPGAGDRLHR
jgi:hypothetical protein